MKTQLTTLMLVLLICTAAKAQDSGWYLTYNTTAVIEPQAAYGLGVGYQLTDNFSLATEFSMLTKSPFFDEGKFTNLKGIRSVTTAKFTIAKNEMRDTKNFVAFELRYKKINYDDRGDFTDLSTKSVIKEFDFKNKTTTIGTAIMFIHQQPIFRYNTNWYAEAAIGIGGRMSYIKHLGTPANSQIVPIDNGFLEVPNYAKSFGAYYFPASVKIIYKF